MKNRWIALVLALAMLLSMVPTYSEEVGEPSMTVEILETEEESAPEDEEISGEEVIPEEHTEAAQEESGEIPPVSDEEDSAALPEEELLMSEADESVAISEEMPSVSEESEPEEGEPDEPMLPSEEEISALPDEEEETAPETAGTENEVDYTKTADENPLFVRGYGVLVARAELYEAENANEMLGKLSRGVVYVLSRADGNRLKIAYATEDGVETGYIPSKTLRPMNESEIEEFLAEDEKENIATPHTYEKNGEKYPLDVLSVEYAEAEVTVSVEEEPETVLEVAFAEVTTEPISETVVEEILPEDPVEPIADTVEAKLALAAVDTVVASIKIISVPAQVGVKEVVQVKAVAYNASGEELDSELTLKSSKTSVLKTDGMSIKGVARGTATLKVTSVNDVTAEATVKVVNAPTKITLNTTKIITTPGSDPTEIAYKLSSGSASAVTWSSSDETVATVDESGFVKGVSYGTATITATTFNGKKATCAVTVFNEPTDISFAEKETSIGEGASRIFAATLPDGCMGDITYTSTNPAIATVNAETGEIQALKQGKTTLTASVTNKVTGVTYTANSELTVTPAPVRVEITKVRAEIGVKEIVTVTAVSYDGNGNIVEGEIELKSSKLKIAAVADGEIKGIAKGTAVISAVAYNGVKAEATVKVLAAPSKIKLNPTQIVLTPGSEHVQIAYELTSKTASAVTWTSSDESVATVDENGYVKGVAFGKATIKGTTFNGKTATCEVTVYNEPTGISFEKAEYSQGEMSTQSVKAILPENCLGDISYSIANEEIATMNAETGEIQALKQGKTTLTASVTNKVTGVTYTANSELTVTPAPVRVEIVEIRENIGLKEVVDVKAVAYDGLGNEINGDFKLETSSKKIVSVSGMQMKGAAKGTTTVSAVAYNGVKADAKVVVLAAPSKITLNQTKLTLTTGKEPVELTYTLTNKTSSAITWSSSNETVAKVDDYGFVKGVSYGTATITATTFNGKKATCAVTVYNEPTGISFAENEASMGEGAARVIAATLPETELGDILYSSSNSAIATVDAATGEVKALVQGKATITASVTNKATNEVFTASYTLTVTPAPVRVEILNERAVIGIKETMELAAVAYDALGNEVEGDLTLKSSKAAYVKADGMTLTGVKSGSATITVSAYNGVKAEFKISAKTAPKKITLNSVEITTAVGNTPVQLTYSLPSGTASAVQWVVEDESIVSVDENGCVYGLAVGTTRVMASTFNGKNALCTVKVMEAPESVELNEHELTLGVGESVAFMATLNEGSAGNISFESSDSTVAAVSKDGTVKAAGTGTATITVTTYNGKTDVCSVTVKPAPTFIKVSQSSVTIGVGQIVNLNELISIDEGSKTTLTFKASSTVVSVLANGDVRGLKVGTTSVKATTHNGLTATVKFVVRKAPSTVKLVVEKPILYIGDTAKLTVTMGSTYMASYQIVSDHPEICEVSADGLTLTAKAIGNAVLTVTTHNGVTATASVEVREHVNSIVLNKTETSITHYDEYTLEATVGPETAYDRSVTWTSSNPQAVSVDENGRITALSVTDFDVIITATTNDLGLTATCKVTVMPKRVEGIALTDTQIRVEKNRQYALDVVFTPENADDKAVTWSSSNISVATVDETGLVTVKTNSGSATITATSHDGGFKASCAVTAIPVKTTGIWLSDDSFEILNHETRTLTAFFAPDDAEYVSVAWSSSDAAIASVDNSGKVTANKVGEATITATVTDHEGSSFTASCDVLVSPIRVTGVTVTENAGLRVDKTVEIEAKITPDNADDQNLVWTSSNPSVVTVTGGEGLKATLKGVKAGSATVKAQTNDGGFIAECAVEVFDELVVIAESNHAKNTTGNTVSWTLSSPSAIGNALYSVNVTRDGSQTVFTSGGFKAANTVKIENAAPGAYMIAVTVKDDTGDTATTTDTVTVADGWSVVSNGLTFTYTIMESETGDTAAIHLSDKSVSNTTITVPETVDGITVRRIDTEAFSGMTTLKTVLIPKSAKVIGARAFKGCTSLENLETY